MKKISVLIFVFLIPYLLMADSYDNFLEQKHSSAKEYTLSLFKDHDIVILCERAHPEITQYDFIHDLISDKRFKKLSGTVITEIGLRNNNERFNRFITTHYESDSSRYKDVLTIVRDISFYPVWSKYNFTDLLLKMNEINQKTPSKQQLTLLSADVPFSWDKVTNREEYQQETTFTIQHRDSLMADFVINYYASHKNSQRKKVLVIMNYRHAFGNSYLRGHKPDNAARYIFAKFPKETANVFINSVLINEKTLSVTQIQGGKWDACFKKHAISDCGFNFKDSPFGMDNFDYFPYVKDTLSYQDVFTGFIYYKEPELHKLILGIPQLLDDGFDKEYVRRANICPARTDKEFMEKVNKKNEFDYSQLNACF